MKFLKILSLLLALFVLFSLCGCSLLDFCENHLDLNGDNKCEICGEDILDRCDGHRDANDDGRCDECDEEYEDGKEPEPEPEPEPCKHFDKDDNNMCDNCGIAFSDGSDNPLDGKKIIFIGNSYTYYGQTVLEKSQKILTQEKRSGDTGYFYQLCQANGVDVSVTNWTFGGHSLKHLFSGNCTANRGCDGEDHKAYILDKSYDYVVIQAGSGASSSASYAEDINTVMAFFREANPNVKFAVLVPYSSYGVIGSTPTLQAELLNHLKTLDAMGVTVIDWGGLIMDILEGEVSVPGTALTYNNNTFIIRKSAKDGYHPNQLSGYITSLMTYCALTGESPVGKAHDFCNDASLRPSDTSKFFNFDKFISTYYIYNNATTNFPDVFASENDIEAIKQLVKAHLEAKAYLDYRYSADEAPNDGLTDNEAVAEGYVAKLANGGVESYLSLSELQTKISKGYTDGDHITLLTDVTCEGATSSNMKKSTEVSVTFDLSGKTLTLTKGSIMRTTFVAGYKSTFHLLSSNGKGTLTLAQGNTYTAFQAYGDNKNITVGSEIGYTDGDVVEINATRLLYISGYYGKESSNSSFIFFGGEYNQNGNASDILGFIRTVGKYNEGYKTKYFAGQIRFIGAKIVQKVASDYPLFSTGLSNATQIPTTCNSVPGIILDSCVISAYSSDAVIHDMETLNSKITYNNCSITGNISSIGTDATDIGIGKVILGAGTTFAASDASFVKAYDEAAIGKYDGTTSGVYLAEGITLISDGDKHYTVATA